MTRRRGAGLHLSGRRATRVTRRVWAYVSAHPQASIREIQDQVGLSSSSVTAYHLRKLEQLDYIKTARGLSRARVVIVPLMTVAVVRREAT